MKNEKSFKHSSLFSLLALILIHATPVNADVNVNSAKLPAVCDLANVLCIFNKPVNVETTQVRLVDDLELKFLSAPTNFNSPDNVKNTEASQLDEVSAPVAGWLFVFALIGFVSFSNKRRV